MSLKELIFIASENAIHAVQIGDNCPLHMVSLKDRQKIFDLSNKLNIQLEVGARRLTVNHLKTYIEIATQMQSEFLRIVIDDADYHPGEAEVIQVINEILPELRRAKVILAIENHDRFPAVSIERIIQKTDPEWVAVCLDTANSLGAGEGINEVIEVLAPYTINLHIKDFTIKRVDHKMGFEVAGCQAGKGLLDVPEVIQKIRKEGRCRTITLEHWSNPEPDMELTIEKEVEAAKGSIKYLKEIL